MATHDPTSTAEQLRNEMRQLRTHMDADVDSFVENTRVLLDWHSYFQSAPWLCLGAAALAGYLVVPSKTRLVTVNLEKLAELARDRKVVVTDQPAPAKASIGPSFGKLAMDLLWRTALAVASQQVNKMLSPGPPSPQGPNRPSRGGKGL